MITRKQSITSIFVFTFLIASNCPLNSIYGQKVIKQTTAGSQSPVVNAEGDVIIQYGISDKDFRKLLTQLGFKDKVIDRLMKTLDEKDVALEEKENTIQRWTKQYLELEASLVSRSPEDVLSAQAKERLDDGDLDGAEKLLQESLELNLKSLEEKRKAAAKNAYEIGSIEELKLDYRGAKGYYEKAVEIDPKNNAYMQKLGLILYDLGDYKKAIEYDEKALTIFLKVYGQEHPEVATIYGNIGNAWASLGDYKKAIEYDEKALAILSKVVGPDHPQTKCINEILQRVRRNQ